MSTRYVVRQGDCIASIAFERGLFPGTIWDDPENAELRRERGDPNILAPGDVVVIPDRRPKEVAAANETRHRFRRKGVPETLRLRLLRDGEPRSSIPYSIVLDGHAVEGTTDGDGRIEVGIPPRVREARLVLREPGQDPEEYELEVGRLDPASEVSGVQMRLANLGLYLGDADGELGPETRAAIEEFQRRAGLEPTGEPDEETRRRIVEEHES